MVYETKFLVPLHNLDPLLTWVRLNLEPDPHGQGEFADEYTVQSLYFDTPQHHVFRKIGSYARAKYRIRRYNDCDWVFLERKLKRQGLVRKRRTTLALFYLPVLSEISTAQWYTRRLAARQLAPACYLQYHRVARQKLTPEGLLRLTIDRTLQYNTATDLAWNPRQTTPILTDHAIVEMKYRHLPALAKRAIEHFNLTPTSASKYRTALRASGLAPQLQSPETNAEEEPTTVACA